MKLGDIDTYLNRGIRRRANRAREKRLWAKAAAGYRRWLDYRPDDGPIWVQLGHMLRESGDLQGADQSYRRASEIMPDDADLLLFRGHLERLRGHADTAEDFYKQSYAQNGDARAFQAIESIVAEQSEQSPALAGSGEVAEATVAEQQHQSSPQDGGEEPDVNEAMAGEPNDQGLAQVWGEDASEPIDVTAAEITEVHHAPEGGAEVIEAIEIDAVNQDHSNPEASQNESVEIEASSISIPPVPIAGAVEHVDEEVVHGWFAPVESDDSVVFTADGVVIGRALPDRGRPRDEGSAFRTLIAIDRPIEVRAHRCSDNVELQGSPFITRRVIAAERPRRRAQDVRSTIIKPLAISAGAEIALFVTHTPTGMIKPHVAGYVKALRRNGIATFLIAATDRPLIVSQDLLNDCAGAIVRENLGYDFAAWAHAIALHPEVYGAPVLYLVNDSVVGPASAEKFDRVIDRIRASTADVVGLTESQEYRWHLQSFFVALKANSLSNTTLHRFFSDVDICHEKDDVIRRFELPLAATLENAGCSIEVLFPSYSAQNPLLRAWRSLLAHGFPFVKLLLLRGAFPDIDIAGWRETLAAAGFDLTLIDEVLHASEEVGPRDADDRLHEHPVRHSPAPGPLKVSFYGPWNYDNGLGAASRGIISALRRLDCRLNLHPIKKPFHVHKSLVPGVDVRDFQGNADIAIIHLNPDSWHLLTDSQREEIRTAKRRIGYWVWEMSHIPDAWWNEFGSVDRIWAPSRYCAELFDAQDGAPVDIIPHPVPVPASLPLTTDERASLLRSLALRPDTRIVLFVFDGSSYLIRKNPAALVRAFAAAGLAERGWTLVLKTKHLMDRVADGAALREMVEDEKNVVIVERNLSPTMLQRLVACADIYASPHASEGFGLTIAEAMAAGRPVIATDFGGSTDYLDASTGYPVRAHPWQLQDDFGHYTRGGKWARVDEPGLSLALTEAALAVERDDHRIGLAARARVRDYLSIENVSKAIERSFADVMLDPPGSSPPRLERLSLSAGVPPERGSGDEHVIYVPLNQDGSIEANLKTNHAGNEWLVFAPRGSLLSPLFVNTLLVYSTRRPDVALFYTDDVAEEVDRAIDQFRLKPEFDQTLLSAQDFIGAPVAIRAAVFNALGGLNCAHGTAVMSDLLFRAHYEGHSIARIPEVLLAHPERRVIAKSADYINMLEAQPLLKGFSVSAGMASNTFALQRVFSRDAEPYVSIIIPTCRSLAKDGSGQYIERLLDNLEITDWPMNKLNVIVGDDIPGEPTWADVKRPYNLRRIETYRAPGEPFNYAAKMNLLWRESTTEQIVFLNDDVRPLSPNWLRALQTFALDQSVGGTGARLLYPDGRLQHAGLLPHNSSVVHTWIFRQRREGTFHDWALVHREWSMVTGAVFATRRSVMEEVGGFDEVFSVEFNDIDLCLRLRALGYRIVYTPYAELEHVEKASRGETPPRGDTIARFLGRWSAWLDHDPSGHPLLRRDQLDMRPNIDRRQWYFSACCEHDAPREMFELYRGIGMESVESDGVWFHSSRGEHGAVIYGPYMPVKRGKYKATMLVSSPDATRDDGAIGIMDVAINQISIAQHDLLGVDFEGDIAREVSIMFDVNEEIAFGFESRIISNGARSLRVKKQIDLRPL